MNYRLIQVEPFGVIVESTVKKASAKDIDIPKLRELLDSNHLIVLRGFQNFDSADEFSTYCEMWGEISLWPFGKVLELVEQEKPEDHIFDHSYVPMHWDGMYRPQVPELQIFSCVSAPEKDQGGRTVFSNTKKILKEASIDKLNLWKSSVGVYQRKMEYYDSKTVAPVVTEHPTKGYPVIRYCEKPEAGDQNFVNHPEYEFTGINKEKVNELHSSLKTALYSKENFYAHAWRTGDIVISDNHTLLHGREAFLSGAPRHIRRVHILGETNLKNPHLVYHS